MSCDVLQACINVLDNIMLTFSTKAYVPHLLRYALLQETNTHTHTETLMNRCAIPCHTFKLLYEIVGLRTQAGHCAERRTLTRNVCNTLVNPNTKWARWQKRHSITLFVPVHCECTPRLAGDCATQSYEVDD